MQILDQLAGQLKAKRNARDMHLASIRYDRPLHEKRPKTGCPPKDVSSRYQIKTRSDALDRTFKE